MLSTIKRIYHNGQITLEETPAITGPVEIFITFMHDIVVNAKNDNTKRIFGIGKGLTLNMAANFNGPLDELKDYM